MDAGGKIQPSEVALLIDGPPDDAPIPSIQILSEHRNP